MALTPRLEIKQTQSTLLTPQLRQAIGLLQLNNLELNEVIEKELASNPLLEREDDHLSSIDETPLPTINDLNNNENKNDNEENFAADIDEQNSFDDFGSDTEGYNNLETSDWSDYNRSKSKHDSDDDFDWFEQRLSRSKSIYEFLDEQISISFPSSADKIIAKILCQNLDAAGYFRADIKELALKYKSTEQRFSKILEKLKTFEPTGIFAQNLSECLKLQLEEKKQLSPTLQKVLENLEILGEHKFKELAKKCNCTPDEIMSSLNIIRTLNPKPLSEWNTDINTYIIPDVYVRRAPNGEYHVELNSSSLPKLLINHSYYSQLKQDKSASRYIKSNLSQANFLIKALHQRATSILRISEEIVLRQYHFFEQGIEHLRPMTLKDIAEALSINESTVSRISNGKYMSTPSGLFELKYFFSNAAGSYIGDETTSTTTIKHKIKCLIDNEPPQNILSDDKIVSLLGQEGIKIARRTVTKYREAMNIPTSGERKRIKRV